ncbi:MAG: hypothetical protein HY908_20645 [Myxococcales bacterium]|nr:hypothetical protein [Myxococcales bacterium]
MIHFLLAFGVLAAMGLAALAWLPATPRREAREARDAHDPAPTKTASAGEAGWRRSSAAGALAFGLGASASYMLLRALERVRDGALSPGLVLRASHVGFVWRTAVALWLGGLVALVVQALAARSPAPLGAPSAGATGERRWHLATALGVLVLGVAAWWLA